MRDCILHGDCLELLRGLEANSIDAVVTDPPYGLGEVKDMAGLLLAWLHDEDDSRFIGKSGFMGKEWDAGVPSPRYWREVYRVLKPGAHVLCFAGTRTQDLMSMALRLAGFECRDTLAWCYGSGFPKSHAIDKAIDKLAGAEREILGELPSSRSNPSPIFNTLGKKYATAPATPEAQRWQGFGSALKPAHEQILLFRKPLAAANLASNVLAWGTGGLNIDASRVGNDAVVTRAKAKGNSFTHVGSGQGFNGCPESWHAGRWPPNLLLSHSADCTPLACADDCAVRLLDEQAGERQAGARPAARNISHSGNGHGTQDGTRLEYEGGMVSRFFPIFYAAKASRRERNAGCEALPFHTAGEVTNRKDGSAGLNSPRAGAGRTGGNFNTHPTVKSTELMKWLCRLITPPNGTVLDCFAGSGSTLVACVQECFHFIGIEQSAEYVTIARARVAHAQREQRPAKPRAKITRLPKRPARAEQLALFA